MPVAVNARTYEQQMIAGCGGVATYAPSELLKDNELEDARNVMPDRRTGGGLSKRTGIAQAVAVSEFPYDLRTDVEFHSRVFIGGKGKYFCYAYETTSAVYFFTICDSVGTVLHSDGFSASPRDLAVASFAGCDIIADGIVRNLKTTDGTSWVSLSSFPTGGTALCPYNNYLFALHTTITSNKVSLQWSNAEDPETWNLTYGLDFSYGDFRDWPGTIIEHNGLLFLFLWGRLKVLHGFGPMDFQVIEKNEKFGCPSQHLAVSTPYGLYFYSPKYGLCSTNDGKSFDNPMLRKIPTYVESTRVRTPKLGTMVWNEDLRMVSLYASQSSSTASDTRIDYFPDLDAFYVQSGSGATANHAAYDHNSSIAEGNYGNVWTTTIDPTPSTGRVTLWKDDGTVYTDNASAYESYILTKTYAQASSIVEKKARKLLLTTNLNTPGDITHTVYVNRDETGTATTMSLEKGYVDTTLGLELEHNLIQHKWSDSLTTKVEYIRAVEDGYLVREA